MTKQEAKELSIAEIEKERERQNKKWGEQNHPMFQKEKQSWNKAQAKKAKDICNHNAKIGKLTWYDILVEEVAEAFAETNPVKQRKEVIQVAAVAVQIIECLDRRKA